MKPAIDTFLGSCPAMIQDRSRKVQNVLDLVEQFSQLLLARDLAPFVRFDSGGYAEWPPRRPSPGGALCYGRITRDETLELARRG